jgi:hypothetical protein
MAASLSEWLLYSLAVPMEVFVECSFARKLLLYRIGLYESTFMGTCFVPGFCHRNGLHVNIYIGLKLRASTGT